MKATIKMEKSTGIFQLVKEIKRGNKKKTIQGIGFLNDHMASHLWHNPRTILATERISR